MTLQEQINSIKKRIEELRHQIGYYDEVIEPKTEKDLPVEVPKTTANDLKSKLLAKKNRG